jgi:hypothetical protein
MYDKTTRIQATREIELLICKGALEVIVASTAELEEESVEESDVGMADDAVDATRVLLRGSVIDGKVEDISADAGRYVSGVITSSRHPSNIPEGAAISSKGDPKAFL